MVLPPKSNMTKSKDVYVSFRIKQKALPVKCFFRKNYRNYFSSLPVLYIKTGIAEIGVDFRRRCLMNVKCSI